MNISDTYLKHLFTQEMSFWKMDNPPQIDNIQKLQSILNSQPQISDQMLKQWNSRLPMKVQYLIDVSNNDEHIEGFSLNAPISL